MGPGGQGEEDSHLLSVGLCAVCHRCFNQGHAAAGRLQNVLRRNTQGWEIELTQTAKYYNVNQLVKSNKQEKEMAAASLSILVVVTCPSGHKPAAGLL